MALVAVDMSQFTKDELFALIESAKRMLYPQATVAGEELICGKCQQASYARAHRRGHDGHTQPRQTIPASDRGERLGWEILGRLGGRRATSP
jgi:hypothetical protein